MMLARQTQSAGHPLRRIERWIIIYSLLLAILGWLPATAQTQATPGTVVLPPVQIHIPLVYGESTSVVSCPLASSNVYETASILGSPRDPDRPPTLDPDLNLLVRAYKTITTATLGLIGINGPTDDDAPQLAYLFRPARVPTFRATHQVHDWDWACCPGGKLGAPIAEPEVTLVEMATTPGEALYPPHRNANIGGDFVALVLFADKFSLTFTYTREDTPAKGYLVHLDSFCVDPTLLALYQETHAAGRGQLPALRRNDTIGTAFSNGLMVAVRDSGSFMDPRSGKDWWQDTVRALLASKAASPETEQR